MKFFVKIQELLLFALSKNSIKPFQIEISNEIDIIHSDSSY